MNNLSLGLWEFVPAANIGASIRYTARLPHPRKKDKSTKMRRKNNPAGAKFKKAFAAGVATYRGKFRHFSK